MAIIVASVVIKSLCLTQVELNGICGLLQMEPQVAKYR